MASNSKNSNASSPFEASNSRSSNGLLGLKLNMSSEDYWNLEKAMFDRKWDKHRESWTFDQTKLFKGLMARYLRSGEDMTPDRWYDLARAVGKSVEELRRYYEFLQSYFEFGNRYTNRHIMERHCNPTHRSKLYGSCEVDMVSRPFTKKI